MWRTGLRKISRDILSRKTRTFLVSASIFVGVMGVIALFTSNIVISRQLRADVDQSKIGMIDITVSVPKGTPLDNDLYLETLNRHNEAGMAIPALDGIEVVEGRAYFFVDFLNPKTGRYKTGEIRANYADWDDIVLEPFRLIEGEYPTPGQKEVALEVRMADVHGFTVGDEITFRGVGDETTLVYTVSGLIFHPYSASNLANSLPGPDIGIYANYEDAQALLNFTGFSRFVARYETFEMAQNQLAGLVKALNEVSPYVAVDPAIEDPANNTQLQTANVFINILSGLGLATILVSGFLVINVINTITSEQKQQIGILKSIGVSNTEAFLIYSGIALVYGVLGTIFAIVPGILMAQVIIAFLAPQLDVRIEGFQWAIEAVLLGIALGLIIPVFSVAYPVYSATRVRIIDAIRDLGISSMYGQGLFPRFIKNLPIPISARQAISNVYEKRWRLALTGMTLIATIGSFMGSLALTVSITNELDKIYGRITYEITVFPNEIQDPEQMRQTLEGIEGVNRVGEGTVLYIQLDKSYVNFFTNSNAVQVFGFDPPDNMVHFDFSGGTGWENDPTRSGFIISSPIAKQLDLEAGDDLNFTIGGQNYTAPIIAVDRNAFDFIQTRWQDLSAYGNLTANAPSPNNYFVETEYVDEDVVAVGLDETLLALLGVETSPENPLVVISGDFAATAELAQGDTLSLVINGETVEREIAQVVPNSVLATNAAQVAPSLTELPSNVALFGFNDLAQITEADLSGEPVPNMFYVEIEGEKSLEHVDEVMARIQTELLQQGISAQYLNQLQQKELFITTTQSNTSIFQVASVLIAIVGAIGLLTTLSISVIERQKEIGVMRSIGAGADSIVAQFMLEGLIVGFLAWLVGLPVGYVVAIIFNQIANTDNFPFTYPTSVILIGLVGMLFISSLASLLPSLGAARKTVSEILRYQ